MGDRLAIICAVVGMLGLTTGGTVSKAVASDIIDEWANVKTPAAPELKQVTADPKTTALIMGDLMNQSCAKRPRCVAALPAMKKLLGQARAAADFTFLLGGGGELFGRDFLAFGDAQLLVQRARVLDRAFDPICHVQKSPLVYASIIR